MKSLLPALVSITALIAGLKNIVPNRIQPVRVACVGNSITFGSGLSSKQDAYPNQLQRRLGAGFGVENFGVSGATVIEKGDKPFIKEETFRAALRFRPDILIIKLGTNDSKAHNWDPYKSNFQADFRKILSSFRKVNPKLKIFVCLPVPVFGEAFGIREQVLQREIRPLIRRIATSEKSELIDLYTPLRNYPQGFPDKVHPNASCCRKIADLVFDELKKKLIT
jgi:lysophospholipase L1-like esterase